MSSNSKRGPHKAQGSEVLTELSYDHDHVGDHWSQKRKKSAFCHTTKEDEMETSNCRFDLVGSAIRAFGEFPSQRENQDQLPVQKKYIVLHCTWPNMNPVVVAVFAILNPVYCFRRLVRIKEQKSTITARILGLVRCFVLSLAAVSEGSQLLLDGRLCRLGEPLAHYVEQSKSRFKVLG